MKSKWRIIFLLFVGSAVYYIGIEKLEIPSYLSLLLIALPMLLGWGVCKIYPLLERKLESQKYIQIIMAILLVPAFIGLFINVRNETWNILVGLALCINAIFSMFFDKQIQEQTNTS
jgi:MFS-type transporter involved in bile tolerance (Atg22 family)